eukprot:1010032-Pleurochrysis_carterae.AAC.1
MRELAHAQHGKRKIVRARSHPRIRAHATAHLPFCNSLVPLSLLLFLSTGNSGPSKLLQTFRHAFEHIAACGGALIEQCQRAELPPSCDVVPNFPTRSLLPLLRHLAFHADSRRSQYVPSRGAPPPSDNNFGGDDGGGDGGDGGDGGFGGHSGDGDSARLMLLMPLIPCTTAGAPAPDYDG